MTDVRISARPTLPLHRHYGLSALPRWLNLPPALSEQSLPHGTVRNTPGAELRAVHSEEKSPAQSAPQTPQHRISVLPPTLLTVTRREDQCAALSDRGE